MTKLNDWFISISPASKQIKEYVSESEECVFELNRGFSIDFRDGSGEDYNNTAVDDTGLEYGGGDDSFMSGVELVVVMETEMVILKEMEPVLKVH